MYAELKTNITCVNLCHWFQLRMAVSVVVYLTKICVFNIYKCENWLLWVSFRIVLPINKNNHLEWCGRPRPNQPSFFSSFLICSF